MSELRFLNFEAIPESLNVTDRFVFVICVSSFIALLDRLVLKRDFLIFQVQRGHLVQGTHPIEDKDEGVPRKSSLSNAQSFTQQGCKHVCLIHLRSGIRNMWTVLFIGKSLHSLSSKGSITFWFMEMANRPLRSSQRF